MLLYEIKKLLTDTVNGIYSKQEFKEWIKPIEIDTYLQKELNFKRIKTNNIGWDWQFTFTYKHDILGEFLLTGNGFKGDLKFTKNK